MRQRIATIFGALMVSLGVALMIASPAAASETNYAVQTTWDANPPKDCRFLDLVSGCIQEIGDVLWVRDLAPNGYSTSLTWKDADGNRSGTCLHTIGADKDWATCNKNFTEGHDIEWALGWELSDGWHFSSWRTNRV